MSTQRGRIQISGFDADRVDQADEAIWDDDEETAVMSRRQRIVQQLIHDKLALIGVVFVVLMIFTVIFSRPVTIMGTTVQPFELVPYDVQRTGVGDRYESPSLDHLMGTDRLGRDMFSRVMAGARYSVTIGFIVTAIAATVGVIFGSISGYFGGIVDEIMMRILDVVFAFPGLILALLLVAMFGGGFWQLTLAFVLPGWAIYARLIRGEILKVKQNEYVLAAKALGARDRGVLFKHVVPNAIAPVIVQATLSIGTVVIGVAALGFLGLGFDPGTPEWGTILDAEQDTLMSGPDADWHWWATVFPGLMIFIFVMSMNMIGDAVNDALDAQVDNINHGGGG